MQQATLIATPLMILRTRRETLMAIDVFSSMFPKLIPFWIRIHREQIHSFAAIATGVPFSTSACAELFMALMLIIYVTKYLLHSLRCGNLETRDWCHNHSPTSS